MAFAIAHIRGGDDLGYQWYLDGKLTKRTNTFNDFVDVAKGLNALGWAAPGNISASGGSAGGELMGAIVNSNPGLWRGRTGMAWRARSGYRPGDSARWVA